MGDNTGIAWADSTVNLWIGCTQLTAACDNCYAMLLASRFKIPWNAPPVRTKANSWDKIARYQRTAARWFKKHGRERRVFINSMSDFFDNQAEQSWRDEACRDFEQAVDVIIMLVTKRPQNVRSMVPPHWMREGGWPPNVWLIVTGENQVEFDRRVIAMMDIPAPVRGVSIEPLLGEIDPSWAMGALFDMERYIRLAGKKMPRFMRALEWVILGGESGPKARRVPMAAFQSIARLVRNSVSKTRLFVKQLCQADFPQTYEDFDTFPEGLKTREHPDHVRR